MSLKIILSYDYPREISQLLNEYTNMLIENDDSVKEILKVQNYDDELKHLKDLYKEFGFYEIESYNDNPFHEAIYMKLDL